MPHAIVGSEPWMLKIDSSSLDLPADPALSLSHRLTSLDDGAVSELKEYDLHVAYPDGTAAFLINRAADLIRGAPELESIVRRCVHEIVVLRAPHDSFDISHSEPRWVTRIFVSIPKISPIAAFRVAEAVVHEAMHLNLTFLEFRTQLTLATELLYSPWKAEPRPASGVLHGIYVFGCIFRFFSYISRDQSLQNQVRMHVNRRCEQIQSEVTLVDRPCLFECLTPAGQSLARDIFSIIEG